MRKAGVKPTVRARLVQLIISEKTVRCWLVEPYPAQTAGKKSEQEGNQTIRKSPIGEGSAFMGKASMKGSFTLCRREIWSI